MQRIAGAAIVQLHIIHNYNSFSFAQDFHHYFTIWLMYQFEMIQFSHGIAANV